METSDAPILAEPELQLHKAQRAIGDAVDLYERGHYDQAYAEVLTARRALNRIVAIARREARDA